MDMEDYKDSWSEANAYDLVEQLGEQWKGHIKINKDGMIEFNDYGLEHDSPWIFVRPRKGHNCKLWHSIFYDTLGVFPPPCLDCWKVVVRPHTFKELMMLLELQDEHTERSCKCGIEVRMTVPALYGGYFYNLDSLEAADCYDEVRSLVDEHISPNVPVFIKRYCTEFELKWGRSDKFELTEDMINKWNIWSPLFIENDTNHQPTAPWVRVHKIKSWMKFAWAHGDMSVMEFNDNKPLYEPSVQYSAEELRRV